MGKSVRPENNFSPHIWAESPKTPHQNAGISLRFEEIGRMNLNRHRPQNARESTTGRPVGYVPRALMAHDDSFAVSTQENMFLD